MKIDITIIDEINGESFEHKGVLNLDNGEIKASKILFYEEGYEYSGGSIIFENKEIEFVVQADEDEGIYVVSPDELIEVKEKASKLFSQKKTTKKIR
jgi:hypothetical protein